MMHRNTEADLESGTRVESLNLNAPPYVASAVCSVLVVCRKSDGVDQCRQKDSCEQACKHLVQRDVGHLCRLYVLMKVNKSR